MKVVLQLCIKSCDIKAENGDYFKAEQGKKYTTTVPEEGKDTITVFSRLWAPLPKENFVLVEK